MNVTHAEATSVSTSVQVSTAVQNWAGNLRYRAAAVEEPTTADEVRTLVASAIRAGTPVRALGTRHSFNDIADTEGVLVSTRLLTGPISLSADAAAGNAGTVTVGAGIRYGELALWLEERGLALANLASLPHISVGGAIATGTHGSGDGVSSLAASVVALELVDGTGELRHLDRSHPDFAGAVVALGALGIVTRVTLSVEPSYQVAQTVYENLGWDALLGNFDAVTSAGYSVSVFTRWGEAVDQVWVKRRVGAHGAAAGSDMLLDAAAATVSLHPLPGVSADSCTPQLGAAGAWLDRLAHFRLDFTPSNGSELQSEYLIPREHAVAALTALRGLADVIRPELQVTELRTVAADDLWLSSSYGTDVLGIHFTWLAHQPEVEALLPVIERALAPFAARPHWGKLFTLGGAEMTTLYPRLDDFRALVARYDPAGLFANAYLNRVLGR